MDLVGRLLSPPIFPRTINHFLCAPLCLCVSNPSLLDTRYACGKHRGTEITELKTALASAYFLRQLPESHPLRPARPELCGGSPNGGPFHPRMAYSHWVGKRPQWPRFCGATEEGVAVRREQGLLLRLVSRLHIPSATQSCLPLRATARCRGHSCLAGLWLRRLLLI